MLPLVLTLHLAQPRLRPPSAAVRTVALTEIPAVVPRLALLDGPEVQLDRHAGGLSAGEVTGGVGAALATTVGAAGLGGAAAAILGTGSNDPGGAVGGGLYLIGQLVALPLIVAYAELALADEPISGSFGRSVGYAFLGQGVAIGFLIAGALLGQPLGSTAGAWIAFGGFYGMQLFGIPMLASLGLHGGSGAVQPAPSLVPTPLAPPPTLQPPPSLPAPVTLRLGGSF